MIVWCVSEHADAELLRQWQAGEQRAGRELFRRHAPAVLRFLRSKLPAAAEDLAQEVFARFLREAAREPAVRPFLFGIARNVLREELRRRDAAFDPLNSSIAEHSAIGSTRLHARARLLRALQVLPLDQQICIELHYWEGFTSQELGECLGISASTARGRLDVARERLRASLSKSFPRRPKTEFDELEGWALQLRALFDRS